MSGKMEAIRTIPMEDEVGLSRKREKELKRLRGNAEDLWQQQQEVLEHAREVVKEASRQVNHLAQEEVTPRVKDLIDSRVKPGIERSLSSGRGLADTARDKLVGDVLPSVAAVIGSTLSMIDMARHKQLQPMVEKVSKKSASALRKAHVPVPEPKSGLGAGGVIGISVGIAALMGIGYAVWQTFRADDELWIADDEPELPTTAS